MRNKPWIKLVCMVLAFFVASVANGKEASLWEQTKSLFLPSNVEAKGFVQDPALWERYKSIFLQKDGRITDFHNGEISHSEGQGYSMLLAYSYGDKKTFDKIWAWTKSNLGVRHDNLFAWSWGKRANGKWQPKDLNTATDGDVLIAYALLKAGKKWKNQQYLDKGKEIVKTVRENLAVQWKENTLILPGYYGFVKNGGFVINPSYIILPAYRYFARVDDSSFWEKTVHDSASLCGKNRFGKKGLPADWVFVDQKGVSLYKDRKTYLGWEAIRSFLYQFWEKKPNFPKGLKYILRIYRHLDYIPRFIDLKKDSVSLESGPAGFYAIYGRAALISGDGALGKRLLEEAKEKLKHEKKNYYSFTLYLLATLEDL